MLSGLLFHEALISYEALHNGSTVIGYVSDHEAIELQLQLRHELLLFKSNAVKYHEKPAWFRANETHLTEYQWVLAQKLKHIGGDRGLSLVTYYVALKKTSRTVY